MVVGIIGILAAVAIPAYNNYTNRASRGVTESALLAASRQVNLNKSTGDSTKVGDLNKNITSKGKKLDFTVEGDSGGNGTILANDASWCLGVDIDGADEAKYQAGCINQAGQPTFETPASVSCSLSSDNAASDRENACQDDGCTYVAYAAAVSGLNGSPEVQEDCKKTKGTCGSGAACE